MSAWYAYDRSTPSNQTKPNQSYLPILPILLFNGSVWVSFCVVRFGFLFVCLGLVVNVSTDEGSTLLIGVVGGCCKYGMVCVSVAGNGL